MTCCGVATANTAADHITVARDALRQLPSHRPGTRPGRRVLVRTDAAGATHTFLDWLCSQRLSDSVGFTLPGGFPTEQAALKCLYLVTRSLDPTGRGRARWAMRWKPALNAFAITFEGRIVPSTTN